MNLEREFSKDLTPDLRQKTAEELGTARRARQTAKSLAEEAGLSTPTHQEKMAQEKELRQMFLGRLFKTQKYLEARAQLEEITREADEDGVRLKTYETKKAEEHYQEQVSAIRKKFQEKLRAELVNCPLTEEERAKYLTAENLTQTDLKSYLALMKRLSGNFVSHVTRYGVREQASGPHKMGQGTLMDSFTPILETKRLSSFFSNLINGTDYTEEAIRQMIDHIVAAGSTEKSDIVPQIMSYFINQENNREHAADFSSVHFAANKVLGNLYGAEVGYDIFFYFPAEVVAHNYHTQSQLGTFSQALEKYNQIISSDEQRNDLGLWDNGQGIAIEAGILCIPKDRQVDSKTGSQYMIADGQPQVNPLYTAPLDYFLANREQCQTIISELNKKDRDGHLGEKDLIDAMRHLNFPSLEIFKTYWGQGDYSHSETIEGFYRRQQDFYLKPTHTISSQQYWENYFAKYPQKKPNKIVYYDSGEKRLTKEVATPNAATKARLDQNGFWSTENLPGYQEHMADRKPQIELAIRHIYDEWGKDHIRSQAREISEPETGR